MRAALRHLYDAKHWPIPVRRVVLGIGPLALAAATVATALSPDRMVWS
jgi:hypothetical protein